MMSESSQRERKPNPLCSKRTSLSVCFLYVENVPKGYMDFMAKIFLEQQGKHFVKF